MSGNGQELAFAFGVPHDINEFHLYTVSSYSLSIPLVVPFRTQLRRWAAKFNARLTRPPGDPLRPINPDNAWSLRITAAAGQ